MRRFLAVLLVLPFGLVAPSETPTANAGALASTSIQAWYGYYSPGTTTKVIRWGETATIGMGMTVGGQAAPGKSVDLWARPYGMSWRKVASAVTEPSGRTRASHVPRFNTTYQWRFTDTVNAAVSVSNYVTVKVATKVTLTLADYSLRPGQTMVARGRTYPPKPGVVATLWRRFPTRVEKLKTGIIRSDGTFRITKTVSGSFYWNVFVTVPAALGNAKGISPNRQLNIIN